MRRACSASILAYRLAPEWLPNYGPVAKRECSLCSSWQHPSLRDVRDIQDADGVEFTVAISLHLLIKLFFQNLSHVSGKEARAQCHLACEIPQEKHFVVVRGGNLFEDEVNERSLLNRSEFR